jgi:hypothetical protein
MDSVARDGLNAKGKKILGPDKILGPMDRTIAQSRKPDKSRCLWSRKVLC